MSAEDIHDENHAGKPKTVSVKAHEESDTSLPCSSPTLRAFEAETRRIGKLSADDLRARIKPSGRTRIIRERLFGRKASGAPSP